jgi:hypothetical protein
MAQRTPLVFGDDGIIQQLQAGDSIGQKALAAILVQNNLILRMLVPIYLATAGDETGPPLSDGDLNDILGELL